ncbi:histone H1.5-like [Platichthys flesus]|uniref:histone H1.5-like n=1 Tax=Platichthys flesus TaxID=8260 RepID=UPI002DBF7C51|nr:histone H1.5-like [Platichthys flesus]
MRAKSPKRNAKPQRKYSGFTVSNMILEAVSASKERHGMSLPALKKALQAGGYNVARNNARVLLTIRRLVVSKDLVQNKGPSGSLKVNEKTLKTRVMSPRRSKSQITYRSPKRSRSPMRSTSPMRSESPKMRAKSPKMGAKSPMRSRSPWRSKSPMRSSVRLRNLISQLESSRRSRYPMSSKSPKRRVMTPKTRAKSPRRTKSPMRSRSSMRSRSPMRSSSPMGSIYRRRSKSPMRSRSPRKFKSPKMRAKSPKRNEKPQRKYSGFTVSNKILEAVSASRERHGMSLPALKKALQAGGYNVARNNARVLLTIRRLVASKDLVQNKGPSGSLKVNKKTPKRSRSPMRSKSPMRSESPKMRAKSPKMGAKSPMRSRSPWRSKSPMRSSEIKISNELQISKEKSHDSKD